MVFQPSSLPSLNGKVFIVTGGNTGIGYTTCLNLAKKGARVYMGARSAQKASDSIAKIKETHPTADVEPLLMDHTSLASVIKATNTFKSKESQLDGLILNAGIMAVPYEVTQDGFESQMQTNYLAHWLLTYQLTSVLLSTARKDGPGSARVVCVSSEGHYRPINIKGILYDPTEVKNVSDFRRYALSKLANVLHAKSLNAQYGPGSPSAKSGQGELWSASLHPGFIDTQMNVKNKEMASWKFKWIHPALQIFGIMRPWEEGCVASLFACASPEFKADMSGLYFDEKAKVKESGVASMSVEEREKLESWTVEQMKSGKWI
jgi:NAD(P)-dependent dehydrogenase (short-subunit alcohol dehydrogenase family)